MRIWLVIASCVLTLIAYSQTACADEQAAAKPAVKKANVASIVLKGSLGESPGASGLFGEIEQNVGDMVRRLDRAGEDDKVSAVLLKIKNPAVGFGRLTELRAAIARTREKGKRVVAQLETPMTADYLIAAACDEIVMPEPGFLVLPGIRAEVMFMKGLFDKVGIEADFLQSGKFKGAAEPFTREGMSEEFRKQYEIVIDGIYEHVVTTIAEDRKLDKKKVTQLIDEGLFTATAAKKAGLIDRIAYEDQLSDELKKQLKVDEVAYTKNYGRKKVETDFSGLTGFMKLLNLMMGVEPSSLATKNKKVALVYAVGPIMTGENTVSLFGDSTIGSDTIVAALRKANEDDTVVSIVLRVDSPGGSAVASDLIWREIQRIEKPVYASMGDTAASGGYYISMGCDKIFAEPSTITGSIGVVSGKLVTKKTFNKVGLNTEVISRGKNSGLFSMEQTWSDSERKVMQRLMDDVYQQFKSKAAAGRGMDIKKLDNLAEGRIWTGQQAKENGLVDEVGTLHDALKAAKVAGGLKADDKAELLILPKPKSIFEQLLDPNASATSLGAKQTVNAIAPAASDYLGEVELWRKLLNERAVLMMPYQMNIR